MKIELAGVGGYGATLYCGTGCFLRRECLLGRKNSKDYKAEWDIETKNNVGRSVSDLEEASKVLANCSYEKGTQWGKEVWSLSLSLSPLLFQSFSVLTYNKHVNEYADGIDIWMSC